MPVTLHLNSTQTMELIKEGGLKVELTDDQAIDVASQLGQLLKSKHHTPVYKIRKKYRFRQVRQVNGSATVSSKVYAHIEGMASGTAFHWKDLSQELHIPSTAASSIWGPLAKLKQLKKIKRVNKGNYVVI